MSTVAHLLEPELMDLSIGRRILEERPTAASESYRAVMTFIPNLHLFFSHVRERGGAELVEALWFRIWSTVEAEKQLDMKTTMDALVKIPNMDDRMIRITFPMFADPKDKIQECIEALDALVRSV